MSGTQRIKDLCGGLGSHTHYEALQGRVVFFVYVDQGDPEWVVRVANVASRLSKIGAEFSFLGISGDDPVTVWPSCSKLFQAPLGRYSLETVKTRMVEYAFLSRKILVLLDLSQPLEDEAFDMDARVADLVKGNTSVTSTSLWSTSLQVRRSACE